MEYFCSKDCPDTCRFEIISQGPGRMPRFRALGRPWDERPFVCRKLKDFYRREVLSPTPAVWQDRHHRLELDTSTVISHLTDFLLPRKEARILYLRGSGSLAHGMRLWDHLMAGLPGCSFVSGGPCMDTGEAAHEEDFGICENPPVSALMDVPSILVFGRDTRVVSPHLHALLLRLQRERGVRVVYIDPVRTRSSDQARAWVGVRPGCDGLLAAALLLELGFTKEVPGEHTADALRQQAGVAEEDFALLADCLRQGPCAIITGAGLQRYANGAATVRWINRLAVRSGNVERLFFSRASKGRIPDQSPAPPRQVPVARLPRLLEQGAFDILWIVASNPLLSYPESSVWEQALLRLPAVVVDTCLSRTASLARFFLRVGGMFSQPDVQGSYFFQDAETRRLQAADSRWPSDQEVVRELAARLSISLPPPENPADIEFLPRAVRGPYREAPLELRPPEEPPPGHYRLLTRSHERYLNSQCPPELPENRVHLHPDTAREVGLDPEDLVRVWSDRGQFLAPWSADSRVPPGVVMAHKSRTLRQGSPNRVIPSRPTDAGRGLALYDAFVRMAPER